MSSFDSFAKINSGITPSSFATIDWMKDIELLVPLYQRLFVWEEEQINQFLEDLKHAYRTKTPYYIGTVTVYRHPKELCWELVDGQQRMTVLSLIGACSHNMTGEDSLWKPFLVKGNGMDGRLRYFARPQDQEDLEKIIKEGSTANKIANANMKRFIEVFGRFTRRSKDGQSFQMDESDFSKYVYEKTTALVAFLPDSYKLNDLNLYFEKMNAVGKQLEAHEILKARYFGNYSAKWNAIADGSKRFVLKEQNARDLIDSTLERLLLNGGDLTADDKREPSMAAIIADSSRLVMSIPVYLLHSLRICIGPNVENKIIEDRFWDPKHLLSTFKKAKDWWKENRKDKPFADAFVEVMEAYRKWMDKWIIHIEDDRPVSPYQQEVARADQYTVECAYEEALWQFQSMLYVSGSEQQGWVFDAYQDSLKCPLKEENKDGFLAMLKQQDGKRHPLNIGDDDPAQFSYGQIDRYWFWKLDYILWENRELLSLEKDQKDAVDFYTFRRNRSIEHLHPQTAENQWEEKYLHSFGNLAMISASFNSQQSNDSVGTKFGRLGDKMAKKELESIKLLLMFNDAHGKDHQWTPDASWKHCSKMMKVLKDYYGTTYSA